VKAAVDQMVAIAELYAWHKVADNTETTQLPRRQIEANGWWRHIMASNDDD
jgi:hypothetical protein